MNTEPANDSLDQRLDAFLAARPRAPRPDFADTVLRAIADEDQTLDALVDARLRHHPLRARAERAERLFLGTLRAVRFAKILRWGVSTAAAAALIALFFLPARHEATPEEIIAKAIAADPALDALLRPQPDPDAAIITLDHETVEAFAGLNDNTLAWLETLTSYEN
jgi:hypothetical protein